MLESPEFVVAKEAAGAAATVLLRFFRRQNAVQFKSGWNLVSEADVAAERAIVERLQSAFPDHEILGEESGQADLAAEHLWIVDPLDGTNNFCHGIAHFAISIAYYRAGQAQLGIVFQPVTGDWFVAGRNRGAFHNDRPCTTGPERRLNQALLGVGFYYDRDSQMRRTLRAMESLFEQEIHGIRRMGTASLDLCMVGTGSLGGYFEFELATWDYAAGKLFVEEAGGRVTDCNGDAFHLGNSSILAASGDLHAALLEQIHPHFQLADAKS